MTTLKNFYQRLQHLGFLKKVFQADLVAALKKDRGTVSRWWNGEIIPAPKNMRKIAEFFGCSIDWLANGVGDPFPADEKSLSIVGNGNIQAGRRVKISGGSKVGTSDQQQVVPFVLDEDEARFIALIREVGGKQALRKFEAELLRLKQIIDKELK